MQAASSSFSGKFERGLTYSLHHELHWLDVSERIQFRVAATVYRCLDNVAPRYLSDICKPIASLSRRQSLRSDTTSDLVIPRVRRSTYGCRAFSVAGPVCWNVYQTTSSHRIFHLTVSNVNSRHSCFVHTRPYCATLAY